MNSRLQRKTLFKKQNKKEYLSLNCFYFEKRNQFCVIRWPLSKLPSRTFSPLPAILCPQSLHPPPPLPGPHFSSFSLSSTVPKLFPSHVFDPESSSEEQPCICQIICSHLEGKAPPVLQTLSFCAELQPVNSTRKTLGIYLLCQP